MYLQTYTKKIIIVLRENITAHASVATSHILLLGQLVYNSLFAVSRHLHKKLLQKVILYFSVLNVTTLLGV
jgi:hypothetical protein